MDPRKIAKLITEDPDIFNEGWDEIGIEDPGIYDVIGAHSHSFANHKEILNSKKCGCFYCGTVFDQSEAAWEQSGPDPKTGKPRDPTAVCPYCGINSVIGDASGFPIDDKFLDAMHEHWFASN